MVSGVRLFLEANQLTVSSVITMIEPDFDEEPTLIKMISPLTVRSAAQGETRNKKNQYFSPNDPDFSKRIWDNLVKKFHAFNGRFPQDNLLQISPLYFSEKQNFHLILLKGYVIKAYSGIYRLTGSPELKRFAYNTGLGERNSMGFGMFELWQEKEG
jgi:CRISPR-associated endoribonuclease Cas6